MSALVGRRLEGWESGQTRDIAHEMALLTLEIVAGPLLGLNADAEMTGAVSAAMDALMACFTTGRNPFGLLPLPPSRREAHAARRLDRLVDGMLRATPAQPPDAPPTLLSQLRAAPSERGGRGLRGQVKTFLAAGHDSSALTLAWTFVLLARHPGADARLAEELSSVLGGRHPCPADLPCLPYTRMVIKETLRLYPPLWMTGRQAVRACEIDGRRVPAGTTVLTSQWAVQRRPQFFRDPDEFRPERWEGEETAGLPRYAYFPFGGGPRACIGTAFALTEAALILASVAHRFRLTLDQAQEVRPWATMTLRPAGAVTMRLEARA
jgi:cytochrome P450